VIRSHTVRFDQLRIKTAFLHLRNRCRIPSRLYLINAGIRFLVYTRYTRSQLFPNEERLNVCNILGTGNLNFSDPNGIRTRVTAVKGR